MFTDGYPSSETADRVRDHLDYLHGVETFMNTIQGVSTYAIREGLMEQGLNDGDVLIFSELMDSRSLFLTANADTVYYISFLDLSDGPLVVETPPEALGLVDDMWFRWVTDFGLPGADRGQGARTCWSAQATTDHYLRVAATSATHAPTTWPCSLARSST